MKVLFRHAALIAAGALMAGSLGALAAAPAEAAASATASPSARAVQSAGVASHDAVHAGASAKRPEERGPCSDRACGGQS